MKKAIMTQKWMDNLVDLAKAEQGENQSEKIHPSLFNDLTSCFAYCDKVTGYHSKSFFMASRLLSPVKRDAIRSLYAFCRTTDDIVDMADENEEWQIERWREDTTGTCVRFNDPVVIAWANTRNKYQIPTSYASQLIDGVKMDMDKKRYQDFTELSKYCYHVASTVGLMSMHIIGFHSDKAIPYAIKLGVALQLTNILRDIEEDWKMGRIYLPQDELSAFGISKDYFIEKKVDNRWKAFMKFQIERTRRLYSEAWAGIQLLDKEGRLAIAAAASFYKKILDKIEDQNYDVFSQRASVSKWGKIRQLPDLLIRYKYAGSLNSFLS